MSKTIQFVKKHEDHSTENGFQFEFFCDSCSKGFKTKFKPWTYATASGVAETLGSIFGGYIEAVSDLGENLKDNAWEKAHAKAFEKAIKDTKPDFEQCPDCHLWICRTNCWVAGDEICVKCAGTAIEEADRESTVDTLKILNCPSCGEVLESDDKFCSNCGGKIEHQKFCTSCGDELEPGDKFCSNCGTAV